MSAHHDPHFPLMQDHHHQQPMYGSSMHSLEAPQSSLVNQMMYHGQQLQHSYIHPATQQQQQQQHYPQVPSQVHHPGPYLQHAPHPQQGPKNMLLRPGMQVLVETSSGLLPAQLSEQSLANLVPMPSPDHKLPQVIRSFPPINSSPVKIYTPSNTSGYSSLVGSSSIAIPASPRMPPTSHVHSPYTSLPAAATGASDTHVSSCSVGDGLTPAVHDGSSPDSKASGGKGQYTCKYCGKRCVCASALAVHLRTHSGEKPFECKLCGKQFSRKSHLKVHHRVHSGEKPFVCEICDKSFSQMSNLRAHARVHSGERPFICEYCEKSFAVSSSLKSHLRVHQVAHQVAVGRYPCELCDKTFPFPAALQRHRRVHETGCADSMSGAEEDVYGVEEHGMLARMPLTAPLDAAFVALEAHHPVTAFNDAFADFDTLLHP
eukprot:m.255276 g.255276  ORF g.255276 m.255276 type:complete len:431 (-) comp19412_c0_seq1:338-1630(-)